jgi:hypothetical protein
LRPEEVEPMNTPRLHRSETVPRREPVTVPQTVPAPKPQPAPAPPQRETAPAKPKPAPARSR